jgi:hypothetical protein
MDAEQFRRSAEVNQTMADYIDEVAQAASSDAASRSIGLDFLFVLAAHATYLWLRNKVDHHRGLLETELRRLMEDEIEKMREKGLSQEEAMSAVMAVSKSVAIRPPDDSVLSAGLALLKGTHS